MYRLVALLILLNLANSVSAQTLNPKRGLAYGYHSPADLQVLSGKVHWWYNWAVQPEASVADVYPDYGFGFVPMAWNDNFNETAMRAYLDNHPDVKYILGFNEPNFIEQANMTPSEAAASWSIIETIADDYNLKIVGPAVNFCGNCVSEGGTTYNDPFDYLDDFFEACAGCRVDYIAVHSYMNTVAALQWYIGEFKKYGKPIWLTEFAGWESNDNINSVNDQINYMMGAVDFLEYDTSVFRYSWFIGRGSGIENYPYIDILGYEGELTPLGEVYVNMPVHDPDLYYTIPGRIEAEAYTDMSGILLERTADVDGFANVGYFDTGDWLEYNVDISEAGEYYVILRIAATANASVEIMLDSVSVLTKNFSTTQGWQNWQSVSGLAEFPAGKHKLRLRALTPGFNINWLEITQEKPDGLISFKSSANNFEIYPNPADELLHISSEANIKTIQILDSRGEILFSLPFSPGINIAQLSPGIYFIRLFDWEDNSCGIQKFIRV